MKKGDKLIKVFAGNEPSVFLLREKLEDIGISVLVKNDSSSAFLLTVPVAIELFISESDLELAEPIIREFIQNNQ